MAHSLLMRWRERLPWRAVLARTLDTVEPIAQRLAGGLGVDDLLLPSPHPTTLLGTWLGVLPVLDRPVRLTLTEHGAAEVEVLGRPGRAGAWAVAGSRHAPVFQLELHDEGSAPPMRARLQVGPGERPIWWRWGSAHFVAEDVLQGDRGVQDIGPAPDPV